MKLQKAMSIRQALLMLLVKNDYARACAENALGAYSKFLYIQKAFNFEKYDIAAIARSWGLVNYKLKSDVGEDSDSDMVMGEVKT